MSFNKKQLVMSSICASVLALSSAALADTIGPVYCPSPDNTSIDIGPGTFDGQLDITKVVSSAPSTKGNAFQLGGTVPHPLWDSPQSFVGMVLTGNAGNYGVECSYLGSSNKSIHPTPDLVGGVSQFTITNSNCWIGSSTGGSNMSCKGTDPSQCALYCSDN